MKNFAKITSNYSKYVSWLESIFLKEKYYLKFSIISFFNINLPWIDEHLCARTTLYRVTQKGWDLSDNCTGIFTCTKEYEIEGRYTNDAARPTIWFYMICRRYSIWIRNICLMYKYRVNNNLFWIFLMQIELVPSAKHI